MESNPPSWRNKQLNNKWSGILFKIFLFTLPFQSSLLIYETLWGRGFLNPYTTISLIGSELFLFLSSLFFFLENRGKMLSVGKKILFWSLLACLGTAALSLVFSPVEDPTLKFLKLIGLFELLLIYTLIVNKVVKVNEIFKVLTWSMSLQAVIAILQLLMNHSLGLGFLGEPSLGSSVAHIAKLDLGSWTLIRSYGTFSHPNILGGFLAISLLGTLLYPPKSNLLRNSLVAIQFLGLVCSFSRSALLGLIVGILMLSYRSVPLIKEKYNRILSYGIFLVMAIEILVLLFTRPLPLTTDPAVQIRIEGYKMAGHIFMTHPLGVGWNLETLFLDENPLRNWMPWDYQPTHNLFLLVWVETGVQGLVAFLFLIGCTVQKLLEHEKVLGTHHEESKKNFFFSMGLIILSTGLVDHYWLTLKPALFLSVVLFAAISRFLEDPVPIKAIKKPGSNHPKKLKPILESPK